MRAAKIVYIILGVFILLPWLIYNIKAYLNSKKNNKVNKNKFPIGRVVALILVSVLIVAAVHAHYRFTIGYQVPLVAERAGMVFSQRIEGELNLNEYQNEMLKQNLTIQDEIITVSDEELQEAGFRQMQSDLLLSERVYPMADGSTVVYLMYDDGETPLYSFIKLTQPDYSWKVISHDVLSLEEFEELNEEMKIKFYHVDF